MSRAAGRAALFAACLFSFMACSLAAPTQSPERAASAAGLTQFDQVVTAGLVFPDPLLRRHFLPLAVEEAQGWRHYPFRLLHRPGMNDARHFMLVVVSVAPSGVAGGHPGLRGGAGPGGGFVEAVVRTADGAYDLRVSLGSRLPASADMPPFDCTEAAARLVRQHAALTLRRR